MIRVLRVIARTNVGGPALQVSVLSAGLDRKRFEQRLLVGSIGRDEADFLQLRAPEVQFIRVPGLGRALRPLDDLRALSAISREIRSFRPHVVHTHTAKAGLLGRVSALRERVPITVHTFHGHVLHGYFSPAVTRGIVLTERALARRTTALVAVGSRVRDELLQAGIGRPDQYRVVPPGIEAMRFPDPVEAKARLDLPADRPVIAFVARLTRVKRPDRFARVAARISARRPDAVFVVAGEGECLAELRQLCKPLGERVRFLGWRDDVACVFAAADVVTLTSDNEGMPVSLIEAAAAGRPAVTTDAGSAREVVRDGFTGFVTPFDDELIADAVLQLVNDPSLALRFGDAAREHARAFTADRLVADTAALYESLCSRGTATRGAG
jgi:glycosyltransferase involved in cell wall biosynthesis